MEDYSIYNVTQKATTVNGVIFLLEAVCVHSDFKNKELNKHLIRKINTDTNEISEWTEVMGVNPFHDYVRNLKE